MLSNVYIIICQFVILCLLSDASDEVSVTEDLGKSHVYGMTEAAECSRMGIQARIHKWINLVGREPCSYTALTGTPTQLYIYNTTMTTIHINNNTYTVYNTMIKLHTQI